MDEQEFRNSMSTLLSNPDSEAINNLISYADELTFSGVATESEYFKNTFVEFVLVTQNYNKETVEKLLEVCKMVALAPHEIRGAANYLKNGTEPQNTMDMVIDGKCDRTPEEYRESKEALAAYENGTLDYHAKPDISSELNKSLKKSELPNVKQKTLEKRLNAAKEKVKAQDAQSSNNTKTRKKGERE